LNRELDEEIGDHPVILPAHWIRDVKPMSQQIRKSSRKRHGWKIAGEELWDWRK
jgi:hypothetical protein